MLFLDFISPPLAGLALQQVLEMCFRYCDYASVKLSRYPLGDTKLQKALMKVAHSKITTTHWFSFYVTEENPLEVLLFPLTVETKQLILDNCSNVFMDRPNDGGFAHVRHSVDDLCLFSQNKLVFGTVSHEYICHVYPPNSEFQSQLQEIYHHWEYRDDDDQQIGISDYLS